MITWQKTFWKNGIKENKRNIALNHGKEAINTTKEEIIRGESKNLEFKVELPKDTKKYTRTVIAFANSQGGNLVIGVDDSTREIVGVDADSIFPVMDSITNAVSASCTPQIVPDISFQTIEGKTVVIARIEPGPNRPYYLKSEGKEEGTYIRVAGTTRHASPEKIKELEMEGAKISWDELICPDFKVTDKQIKKLCRDIMKFRQQANLPKRQVTRTQLENWKLLKETDGVIMASNAFVLLTSEHFPFSRTQCAVFKGTGRSVFLDKRTFSGPVYEQIEEAVEWVLRNIRLGARINGLLREENYELPTDAIREMIVNAHCHRNLTDEACVQVSIYDDRLEVSSPGGLYNGLTYEDIMHGRSRLRNRTLANVFNQMGLIEAWGTGIQRIQELAKEYNLPAPEFIDLPESFQVNLYRNQQTSDDRTESQVSSVKSSVDAEDSSVKSSVNVEVSSVKSSVNAENSSVKASLNNTQKQIIRFIQENNHITASEMAGKLSISVRAVEKSLRELKKKGIVIRYGSTKTGHWEINGHAFSYDELYSE